MIVKAYLVVIPSPIPLLSHHLAQQVFEVACLVSLHLPFAWNLCNKLNSEPNVIQMNFQSFTGKGVICQSPASFQNSLSLSHNIN